MSEVLIKTLEHYDEELGLPFYGTEEAAGADIKACFADKKGMVIGPGQRVLVPTGLSMAIAKGHELQVRPRSGLSLKSHLLIVNSPGTIDSDYRGEVKIIMGNFSQEEHFIAHGERIAQLVLCPVIQGQFKRVQDLDATQRGDGGFGSTGKN